MEPRSWIPPKIWNPAHWQIWIPDMMLGYSLHTKQWLEPCKSFWWGRKIRSLDWPWERRWFDMTRNLNNLLTTRESMQTRDFWRGLSSEGLVSCHARDHVIQSMFYAGSKPLAYDLSGWGSEEHAGIAYLNFRFVSRQPASIPRHASWSTRGGGSAVRTKSSEGLSG